MGTQRAEVLPVPCPPSEDRHSSSRHGAGLVLSHLSHRAGSSEPGVPHSSQLLLASRAYPRQTANVKWQGRTQPSTCTWQQPSTCCGIIFSLAMIKMSEGFLFIFSGRLVARNPHRQRLTLTLLPQSGLYTLLVLGKNVVGGEGDWPSIAWQGWHPSEGRRPPSPTARPLRLQLRGFPQLSHGLGKVSLKMQRTVMKCKGHRSWAFEADMRAERAGRPWDTLAAL